MALVIPDVPGSESDTDQRPLWVRISSFSVASIVVNVLLSSILLIQTIMGPPVHISPPMDVGLTYPGWIDDLTATDFAGQVFQASNTFSAVDYDRMILQLKLWFDPSLHKDLDARAAKEKRLIRNKNMSFAAYEFQSTITTRKGDAVLVHVEGPRRRSVAGHELDPENISMDFVLRPAVKRGLKQPGIKVTQFTNPNDLRID